MAYVRQHPEYPNYRMKVGIMPDFSGSNYADQEMPKGVMDGINRLFELEHKVLKNSEEVYKDGMRMARASSLALTDGDYYIDYLANPVTLTFSNAQVPQPKSIILVGYKYLK